uniref:Uncharacterized protein n=1 Tax=Ascaris lumbricoides TaxID=6252 RepID=A0A0M3IHV1_ASCLU
MMDILILMLPINCRNDVIKSHRNHGNGLSRNFSNDKMNICK